MLRNATIRQDIKIYKEISSLFPCKNVRFEKKEERDHGNICLLVEQFIAKYEDMLKECLSCFGQNNGNALLDAEQYIINEITGLIRNGILFYKES